MASNKILWILLNHLFLSVDSQMDMDMDDSGSEGADESALLEASLDSGGNAGMFGFGNGPGLSPIENLKIQTLLALQELGIVIGVAFMVASIFLLMVMTEKAIVSLHSRYHRKFGRLRGIDVDAEADPAALVGTFKRYKN